MPPTATSTITLEQKLRGILKQDDTGAGPIGQAGTHPGWHGFEPTSFELDMRDWGVYYGIAFGIARGEDAYEPHEQVAARALEAARSVHSELGGFTRPPERDQATDELRRHWATVPTSAIVALPPGCVEAVERLLEARS